VIREPEAWETDATGPFVMVGKVSVTALGTERFRIVSPSGAREFKGSDEVRRLVHELAITADI